MDYFTGQVALLIALNVLLTGLGIIAGWLLLYSAIRTGVNQGMRSYTRWVDEGKDQQRYKG